MIIYPKTCENLIGLDCLKKYVEKYKGAEIQLLSQEQIQKKTYDAIKRLKAEVPQLEEVTIHIPFVEDKDDYNFEVLAFSKLEIEKERLKKICEISKELNIKVNLLYHTKWDYESWNSSGAIDRMKELLEIIQNSNVTILIENVYALVERKECAVLKVAKAINNKHLKVCLDICHIRCVANMFKFSLNEFLNTYLNKEDCQKYIQQIHFAGTLNNDGYIDKKTHGRVHDSWESFEEDYNILKQFGIEDKIIVPEVSEDDYSTRKDQIEEIKMLLKKENKKLYKVGMYGGKFMPFHKGHLYCVEQASKMCEKLYVILFVGGEQELEILKTRNEKWLQREDREKHIRKACERFNNVEVVVIDTTKCKNSDGTENWDMETPLVLNACGKLDAVFGSEPDYGDYYKRAYPGAEYIQIDVERKNVPISATMIRNMKSSKEREKWII